MGKVKLLIDVIEDIRALANSLESIANVVIENETYVEEDKVLKKDLEDQLSLEEVRGVLAKKSQEGLTDEIRSIIKKYGCNKLSEVEPKHYRDIIKEVHRNSSNDELIKTEEE